jgi:hypothetical protein
MIDAVLVSLVQHTIHHQIIVIIIIIKTLYIMLLLTKLNEYNINLLDDLESPNKLNLEVF